MISNELILAGKLQWKKLQKKKPEKPEFFSGFFFCNFFNCSLPARINSLLITRRSNMIYFIYYLWLLFNLPTILTMTHMLLITFPNWLAPWHKYAPPSSSVVFLIVSWLPLSLITCLLMGSCLPDLVHVTTGVGKPNMSHFRIVSHVL